MKRRIKKKFVFNKLLPTLLTEALFVILIFSVIVPHFNSSLIDAKKEMIKEIINSSISIVKNEYHKSQIGLISETQAKENAISTIKSIRYGTQNKDYVWITDETPIMIMHPYRTDLNGKNVKNFKDPNGFRMFYEMVKRVRSEGSAYVDYQWQWMDDTSRIVPKISYITEFKDWKWIIGTGVYIEDIRESIAGVVNSLIWTSLAILGLSAFLMWIILNQNLKIERKRKIAEEQLKESNDKYKALVEASDDGTLMFLGRQCIFHNQKAEELINCSNSENITPDLKAIIPSFMKESILAIDKFLDGEEISLDIETKISSKESGFINVLLSFTRINIAEKDSLIIRIRNLQPYQTNEVLNYLLNDIFSSITERFNIGVFRAVASKKAIVSEANNMFLRMFGADVYEDLSKFDIFELFDIESERNEFQSDLTNNGYVRDFIGTVISHKGEKKRLRISAILKESKEDGLRYIDGFITDNYFLHELNQKEAKIVESVYAHQNKLFLSVAELNSKEIKELNSNTYINDAIELFNFHSTKQMLFSKDNSNYLIEFNELLFANIIGQARTVSELGTKLINGNNLFDSRTTLLELLQKGIASKSDYFVIMKDGKYFMISLYEVINSVLINDSLLGLQIADAKSFEELKQIHQSLPIIIKLMANVSSDIAVMTKKITLVSDGIGKRIIDNCIKEIGEPPVKFAFITLGSEGRSEQGLTTDQDNAIIYDDSNDEDPSLIADYFLKLGSSINNYLDDAGYKLCVGEIMARNPKWNQSLKVWKSYFNNWILSPEPQNIIESVIFFDFRLLYGDEKLVENLRRTIKYSIKSNNMFLNQLAITTVNYKLPVGLFGKIQTENKDKNIEQFNLKNAIRLLVSIVRLYSMKYGIEQTNTLERLDEMNRGAVISSSFYKELKYSYEYLMKLQFENQCRQFSKGYDISNYIDLSLLTPIELTNFKSVLSTLANFQSKVKYNFGISN